MSEVFAFFEFENKNNNENFSLFTFHICSSHRGDRHHNRLEDILEDSFATTKKSLFRSRQSTPPSTRRLFRDRKNILILSWQLTPPSN